MIHIPGTADTELIPIGGEVELRFTEEGNLIKDGDVGYWTVSVFEIHSFFSGDREEWDLVMIASDPWAIIDIELLSPFPGLEACMGAVYVSNGRVETNDQLTEFIPDPAVMARIAMRAWAIFSVANQGLYESYQPLDVTA